MVEFALVIPVFLLLVSGILDFGFALFARMTVINAARDAARSAVSVANFSTIPTIAPAAVAANAPGLVIDNLSTSTSCVHTASGSGCASAGDWAHAVAGDSVKVAVTYAYHPFFPLLFGTTIDLGASVQMVLD